MSWRRCAPVPVILALILVVMPTPISQGQEGDLITGQIDNDTPFIEIPLTVEQDDSDIILDITPVSGDLDTLLYLVDSAGSIVAENDDRSRDDYSSLIEFPQAAAGQYTVIATRYGVADGDTQGDFELRIQITADRIEDVAAYNTSPEALEDAGYPPIETHEVAEWTILVYYGADNNLEPGILHDFNEFERAGGSSNQVRIAALLDRSPYYTDASGDWSETRLFEISPNASGDEWTIDTTALAALGETDTSYGENLAQFLVWGVQNYPANHYIIAMGSHGAAWEGLITDDSTESSNKNRAILSLPELQQAFATATQAANVEQFDLLVNDACLMGSLEYLAALSPYFNYTLASPEIVVDPALDMTVLADTLKADPNSVNLVQLGIALIDQYITQDIVATNRSDVVYYTHALTDLARIAPIVDTVEDFAKIVNTNPTIYSKMLGQVRSNTYTYTFFSGSDTKIDLGHFMRQVIAHSTDADLIFAAQNVLAALMDARVYANAGAEAIQKISYYNIYFPAASDELRTNYFTESPLKEWGKMLRNFYNTVTPQVWVGDPASAFHLPIAPRVNLTSVYPNEGGVTTPFNVGMEIVGRNLSHGVFTVDQVQADGSLARLETSRIVTHRTNETHFNYIAEDVNQWMSGVDISTFNWEATLPVITDGTITNNELIVDSGDGFLSLEGRYREAEDEAWVDISVIFDDEGTVQRVVSRNPANDALGVIEIPTGSAFQAYRSIVTPDGRVTLEPGNSYTWPEGGIWEYRAPAPSGEYNLGFMVSTFGGTTGFDSVPVTVNNEGVSDLTGYTDLWIGAAFAYPSGWDEPIIREDRITVNDEDNISKIEAYYFVPSETDLESIVDEFANRYVLEVESELTPITVSGQEALAFYLSKPDEGWEGRAFVIYHESLDWALAFVAEAWGGGAEFEPLYQLLLDEVTILDVGEASAAVWDFAFEEYETFEIWFPIHADWLDNAADVDIWRGYGDQPSSMTFVRYARVDGDDSRAILSNLLSTHVEATTENYTLVDTRTYHGETFVWEAARYTVTHDDQPVTGRMYVTIAHGIPYAMWFEMPSTDETTQMFTEVLEPMLDGFVARFYDTSTYASGSYGFALEYPVFWDLMSVEDDRVFTEYYTGTAAIRIYPVIGASSDLETIANTVIDRLSLNNDGEFDPITVGEQDALAFSYSAEDDNGTWNARAFAMYHESLDLGLVFAAEVFEENADLRSIYQLLLNTVELWKTNRVGDASYPVPPDWEETSDGGDWRNYTPAGSQDDAPFITVARLDGNDAEVVARQLLAEQAGIDAERISVRPPRFFYEDIPWVMAFYATSRDGQYLQGYLYVTVDKGGAYAIWAEAPYSERWTVYETVIEPIVGGFIIE